MVVVAVIDLGIVVVVEATMVVVNVDRDRVPMIVEEGEDLLQDLDLRNECEMIHHLKDVAPFLALYPPSREIAEADQTPERSRDQSRGRDPRSKMERMAIEV